MRGIVGWCAFVPLFAVQVDAIGGLFDVQLLHILGTLDNCAVCLLWWIVLYTWQPVADHNSESCPCMATDRVAYNHKDFMKTHAKQCENTLNTLQWIVVTRGLVYEQQRLCILYYDCTAFYGAFGVNHMPPGNGAQWAIVVEPFSLHYLCGYSKVSWRNEHVVGQHIWANVKGAQGHVHGLAFVLTITVSYTWFERQNWALWLVLWHMSTYACCARSNYDFYTGSFFLGCSSMQWPKSCTPCSCWSLSLSGMKLNSFPQVRTKGKRACIQKYLVMNAPNHNLQLLRTISTWIA